MCKDSYDLSLDMKMQFVQVLKELQHEEGGFRGSPRGYAHLIATYAAIMSIVNLGIKEAYDIVDIPKMKNFLLKMKNNNFDVDKKPSYTDKNGVYLITRDNEGDFLSYHTAFPGTFQNHINGESDLRSTYCAMTTASVLNLINWNDIANDPLTKGVVENIKNCQTFEGGLGPEPYCEAHGGYSYCGIATLVLLNKLYEIDVDSFVRWLVSRQMTKEGGFNGRTNKLVDSCYSFWQGSIFNLLYMANKNLSNDMELLYDQLSLQAYILFACQNTKVGGLCDKPGKFPDLFHTNYATAGLALSQECQIDNCKVELNADLDKVFEKVNPIYCTTDEKVKQAIKYYAELNK
jgi:protein farnesyltransferase subunit beta